jgi:hypothetical protein
LDAFVIAAQARGLNILMQAPVVGGNAGGPPDWAGRWDPPKIRAAFFLSGCCGANPNPWMYETPVHANKQHGVQLLAIYVYHLKPV